MNKMYQIVKTPEGLWVTCTVAKNSLIVEWTVEAFTTQIGEAMRQAALGAEDAWVQASEVAFGDQEGVARET